MKTGHGQRGVAGRLGKRTELSGLATPAALGQLVERSLRAWPPPQLRRRAAVSGPLIRHAPDWQRIIGWER